MQKQLIAFILIIFSLFGLIYLVSNLTKPPEGKVKAKATFKKNEIIYYYGNTCPHCQELSDWLEKNKIAEKVKFVKKEVYQNQGNAQELQQAAAECGLDTSSIGVPFVYGKGNCYVGSDKAKEFFQKESAL